MGCGVSNPSINDEAKHKSQTKEKQLKISGQRFAGVKMNASLLCRDEFISKRSGEVTYKWRQAEILSYSGENRSRIFVHFVGWHDKYNTWVDLNDQIDKVAPPDYLSPEQCQSGSSLSTQQLQESMEYFKSGILREKSGPPLSSSLSISTDHEVNRDIISVRLGKSQPAIETTINQQYEQDPTTSLPSPENNSIRFTLGQMLDVLDIYRKVGADYPTYKWRKAVIIGIKQPSSIKVHYMEWDPKYDEVLDINADSDRIKPYNSMTYRDGYQKRRSTTRKANSVLEASSPSPIRQTVVQHPKSLRNHSAGNAIQPLHPSATYDRSRTANDVKQPIKSNNHHHVAPQPNNRNIEYPNSRTRTEPHTNKSNHHHDYEADLSTALDTTLSSSSDEDFDPERENRFIAMLRQRGLHVIPIEGDGNCLFRAVSHQLYNHENHHMELRRQCVDHLIKHRSRFESFCDIKFQEHVNAMKIAGTWGDDLEIRALEELIDRIICIYSPDLMDQNQLSMQKSFEEEKLLGNVIPLSLSYHGRNHFNSILDDKYPLPIPPRSSSTLLSARVALFKDIQHSHGSQPDVASKEPDYEHFGNNSWELQ